MPQIADFLTLIRTSLGPTSGTGTSAIQIPGSAFAFTSARIMFDIVLSSESLDPESLFAIPAVLPDHLEFAPDLGEGRDRAIDVG